MSKGGDGEVIIQRLNKLSERQKSWMKDQGIDVDRVLRDSDSNAMQVLSVSKNRYGVETLDQACPLSLRIKSGAHEPIHELVYMDTKPILQRGK